ncbi:MAG: response regulator [Methylococcaceae bacterium]|nr:response regulator [Methylococcaceae bacterium]
MNSMQSILLIEDDQVDVMTVKRGFKDLGVLNPLVTAANGEEALQYLHNPDQGLPCVILLDINMPKMNGHELLAQLKQHSVFMNIPVIMLTSSKEQQDVDSSFEQGISGYILKPVDYQLFLTSIQVLNPYWTLAKDNQNK